MAFHRKMAALQTLQPDVAVVGECADPDTLAERGLEGLTEETCLWMGASRHKGLGIFAFNGFRIRRHEPFRPTLRYVLPVQVTGPESCNLMGVWAQNASGGVTRKRQLGPLRRGLSAYRSFLTAGPTIVGGDLNNNAIWDRPGWRINHMAKVGIMDGLGLVSAYHALKGEAHGQETEPTHYWRDRRVDGPTYHLDYAFVPRDRIACIKDFHIGSFDDWVGNGLSDHVPVLVDIDLGHC
ncbi:MAG: hypothetical protein AAGF59_09055 [Pseudomonadota bacterium]